ncbi:MAG: hypothetical protein EBR30_10935 [Cytophagia bacterium]|nr:hypothetical protein [Cytophagia bacterium]
MGTVKNSVVFLVAATLSLSCVHFQNSKKRKDGFLFFRSVLDDDVCNLRINDSLYFFNQKITTDRSLGFDNRNRIKLKGFQNPIKICVSFQGDIMAGERNFNPIIRRIQLDTVFDLRQGMNLVIEAGVEKIEIGHSMKRIKFE